MGTPDATSAERALDELNRLRETTRATAHSGVWLPATLIAVLLLGSISLYRWPFGRDPAELEPGSYSLLEYFDYPSWAGLADVPRDATLSYLYWFIGVPLLFVATGLWYRRRERRYGMRVNWRLFAGAGMGSLLVLAVLAAVPVDRAGGSVDTVGDAPHVYALGLLTPLVAVVVSVFVLAAVERSLGLVVAGLWLALITVWQSTNAGDLGGIPGGNIDLLGVDTPGGTLVVMAVPLLIFALARAVRAGRLAR